MKYGYNLIIVPVKKKKTCLEKYGVYSDHKTVPALAKKKENNLGVCYFRISKTDDDFFMGLYVCIDIIMQQTGVPLARIENLNQNQASISPWYMHPTSGQFVKADFVDGILRGVQL